MIVEELGGRDDRGARHRLRLVEILREDRGVILWLQSVHRWLCAVGRAVTKAGRAMALSSSGR